MRPLSSVIRPSEHPEVHVSDALPNATVTVSRVPVDGTTVRVSTIGAPGDRAFVLVAGLGVAATHRERLASNLNAFGPVHALDLPGFAGVRRFRGTVSIERYADAVEAVIDALGLVDPVLVGHSMGAQVVTEVAARRPDLSDVVLISPVVDSAARTVSESMVRFARSVVHEPAAIRWHALTAYALCGWHWFRAVLPRMLAYPIERRAEAVQARVLVVRGEHDALVPRDWVRRLGRVFPYAVLREVTGGAHAVVHAQADVVAALAVAHVRGDLPDRGVASLTAVADTTTRSDLDRLRPAEAWHVLVARIRDLVGKVRGDDLVAAGKTEHARATAHDDEPVADAEQVIADGELAAGSEDGAERRADGDERSTPVRGPERVEDAA
ncbi:alpha/beta hydrolase [Curtobacterium sp. MCBD17_034]|nr:alpha/beta hydrolase [Curtobacterium sp. MCBD17_034]PZM39985.1 alpha/beta hydrolase [Curtobacterium sp. MCBD17_031]